MAQTVKQENVYLARKFQEQFGYGTISVDEFDMFIIDNKMVADPGTSDKKSHAHKGFVQERNAIRRTLNNAGVYNNGNSFQIVVDTGTEGDPSKGYKIIPWETSAKEITKELANKTGIYVNNKVATLKALHNKAETLCLQNHDNDALRETTHMLSFMRQQGVELQSRIAGLIKQYNIAYDQVEEQVREVIKQYELPAPSNE
jgi:hypothetical protein